MRPEKLAKVEKIRASREKSGNSEDEKLRKKSGNFLKKSGENSGKIWKFGKFEKSQKKSEKFGMSQEK